MTTSNSVYAPHIGKSLFLQFDNTDENVRLLDRATSFVYLIPLFGAFFL